jgi:hypothetical protein
VRDFVKSRGIGHLGGCQVCGESGFIIFHSARE